MSGAASITTAVVLRVMTALPGFERELRLLPGIVRRGDVCLDIGASLGVYSVTLSALVGRGGAVHAVEPRRSAARRLRRIAAWLRLTQLTVYDCAVGEHRGSADIVVPGRRRSIPGRSYLSLGALHHDHDDGLVERSRDRVDVHTIDEMRQRVGRRVALIKCDVEGFELAVLRGATSVLRLDRPVILCEIEARHTARYGHKSDDVEGFLRRHHYDPIELNGAGSDGGRNQLWVPRAMAPSEVGDTGSQGIRSTSSGTPGALRGDG